MTTKTIGITLSLLFVSFLSSLTAQNTIYEPLVLEDVTYAPEDFGKMWTFDAVPTQRFEELYEFKVTEDWLEDVRLSALEFSTGCSASFVSKNGLIMTNHHCVRGLLPNIQQEGENLQQDGFYAAKMSEERAFPNIYVDQLLSIEDVTEEIQGAMAQGKNNEEQVKLRDEKIKELAAACEEGTGNKCRVITLYNGGKYVLHSYKRYSDVRLVMAPDVQIAATGWDWDNFTYPRYELDFAFLRAYDEKGQPVESPHYFQWSEKGAAEGEPVFVIGRPGNTDRLLPMAQIEFHKNHRNPTILTLFNELYQAQFAHFQANPARQAEMLSQLLSIANGRKVFAGYQLALNDEYLMVKKRDFEKELKKRMNQDKALYTEYQGLYGEIETAVNVLNENFTGYFTHQITPFTSPAHLLLAQKLVDYAEQMNLPEAERPEAYQGEKLEETKKGLVLQTQDMELEKLRIQAHANYLAKVLGKDSEALAIAYGGHTGEAALQYILDNAAVASPEKVAALLDGSPKGILEAGSPYLRFARMAKEKLASLGPKMQSAQNTLDVQNQRLARLIFEAFGTEMPPDATGSLRISDGRILGYEYNGTLAPAKTTYYGLWDRYYSFGEKAYPWGLHERWQKIPAGLDLSIPICFASDNDIVGGNSGSAVINRNAEVVGLVHDGNLESIAGSYAFLPEENRAISTDSWGLMEGLRLVYKAERLVEELENGGIH
ncbi:MAG: S46 family peptidase [Lewinellaceae bacterium]|nr:S46 family peptidase [Lewinellaceae bacterium]